jgi:hypothetical protein
MVNFRFHVVSLAAIFLALAAGVVMGAAALRNPVTDSLRARAQTADEQNRQLRDQLEQRDRRDQLDRPAEDGTTRDDLVEQLAPGLLRDRLAARRVLVLSTDAGAPYVDGVVRMLNVAGATVSGRVEIAASFVDPERSAQLLELATAARPPGVTSSPAATTDGVASSAALLAAVLMTRIPEVSTDDRQRVLAAYQSLGYLTGTVDLTAPADAVVLVSGAAPSGPDAAARTQAMIGAVVEFDRAGPIVLAAGSAAGGGTAGQDPLVGTIRDDPELAASVSTVDNVGTAEGRLVTGWAVADQLGGTVGHYGTGPGSPLVPSTP